MVQALEKPTNVYQMLGMMDTHSTVHIYLAVGNIREVLRGGLEQDFGSFATDKNI